MWVPTRSWWGDGGCCDAGRSSTPNAGGHGHEGDHEREVRSWTDSTLEVDEIRAEDGKLVLLGTLDGMDCRTEVANCEVMKLVRLGCRPAVIRALARQLLNSRRGTP